MYVCVCVCVCVYLICVRLQRVFWRGLAEELFWFIAGSTDANLLAVRHVYTCMFSHGIMFVCSYFDRTENFESTFAHVRTCEYIHMYMRVYACVCV